MHSHLIGDNSIRPKPMKDPKIPPPIFQDEEWDDRIGAFYPEDHALYSNEHDDRHRKDMAEAVRATAASMYGNGPEDDPDQSGLY